MKTEYAADNFEFFLVANSWFLRIKKYDGSDFTNISVSEIKSFGTNRITDVFGITLKSGETFTCYGSEAQFFLDLKNMQVGGESPWAVELTIDSALDSICSSFE